jgi:hypothetical protein
MVAELSDLREDKHELERIVERLRDQEMGQASAGKDFSDQQ